MKSINNGNMRKGESLADRQQEMKEKWNNLPRKRRKKIIYNSLGIKEANELMDMLSNKLTSDIFNRESPLFKRL